MDALQPHGYFPQSLLAFGKHLLQKLVCFGDWFGSSPFPSLTASDIKPIASNISRNLLLFLLREVHEFK